MRSDGPAAPPTGGFRHLPSPPGPKGNLLTGNAHDFLTDRLATLTRGREEFGDVVRYRIGPMRGVVVSRPELIEEVLVHKASSFKKDVMSHMLHPATGDGIFLSEGEFWKRQRRMVTPAFHKDKIALYADVMVSYQESMCKKWDSGGERDVVPDITEMALGIVAKTLFSVDIDHEHGRTVAAAMTEVMAAVATRITSALPLPEFVPTPLMLRLKRGVAKLDKIIYQFIEDRQTGETSADDLLSLLLDARDHEGDGTGMTDRQVRDEAMTIFMAGFETTSLSLAWMCHLLATHPEIQARLRREAAEVLGERRPTAADYPELRFTEGVVNETLRLYPPVAMIGREALVDVELGGFRIDKGTAVWPAPWITHRDPQLWDMPLDVRPERWASENREQLPKHAFLPFGGGPHNCVGRLYAMMEMVLGIATIVRRFELEPVPGNEPHPFPGYTIRPEPGVTVKLVPRLSNGHQQQVGASSTNPISSESAAAGRASFRPSARSLRRAGARRSTVWTVSARLRRLPPNNGPHADMPHPRAPVPRASSTRWMEPTKAFSRGTDQPSCRAHICSHHAVTRVTSEADIETRVDIATWPASGGA